MDKEFYQRTEALLGTDVLGKLMDSWVAVVGLGGVGSFAAEALIRSGIGHLTLVDGDCIEPSNFNRQLEALFPDLGRSKVEAIAERAFKINPHIKTEKFVCRYSDVTSEQILNPGIDYVIDAIDDVPAKIHLLSTCLRKNIPIVSSMGAARRFDPSKLKISDIKDTYKCPLAKKVRLGLRRIGIESGIDVVFSQEEPKINEPGTLGSMIFVPASAGLLLASWVIKRIANIE
ncbi:MAG: tRNA threonylcarbamoyladenosine dehydratase [Syntrophomonadaceae bacterium]|jgi:tRNA A37 threonylcarbamoyladenosine dehydratase|nr:tRNA threonylcarbamoyladenosine dehydratase [Syntrophomonadaceae bacterium]